LECEDDESEFPSRFNYCEKLQPWSDTKQIGPESPSPLSLDRVDITNAKDAYNNAEKESRMTVSIPVALTLIQTLQNMGELDLWHFVLRHPMYTTKTTARRCRHALAARSTESFIDIMKRDLEEMLCTASLQTRRMSIEELEGALEEGMREDLVWWMYQWVYLKEERMGTSEDWKSGGKKWCEGCGEMAERCVRLVVAVLIWWDSVVQG
jgi:hypothetical protein